MMQSSPPTRAWERAESPTDSQYSIDFAALDGDLRSGASTPLPEQHVDRILSEDIDGPSDFTQNMEVYMRGGTLKKKSNLRGGLQALKETNDQQTNVGGANDDVGLLTPKPDASMPVDEHSASHHTPSGTPPKESVFIDERRDEEGEENSSDWDPYAEAATPHPPPHKQFLQPTVEDYYSELMPARTPSAHLLRSLKRKSTLAETGAPQHMASKSDPSTPGRASSETMSPVHSPVYHRPAPGQFSSQTDESTFEQHLHNLCEQCQRLERLNATLSEALDEERRLRIQETAKHEAQSADAARREKDLTELKDQACAHKEDFRREFGELRERFQRHDQEQQDNRRETERLRREHTAEVRRLKDETERETADHNQEILALEQDLELARRARDDAEENVRTLREELNKYHDVNEATMNPTQLRLQQDETLRNQISELEDQIRNVTAENAELTTAKRTAEEVTSNIRTELAVLRQAQDEEISRLTSDHRRAVSLAEDLQTKLKALRKQVKDQQVAHGAEMEHLKNGATGAQPSPTDDMQQLRAELDAKQTALNTAILERDAAQDSTNAEIETRQSALNDAILERDAALDSVQSLRAELESVKLDLTDREAVDLAVDVRVSDAIRRREVYWRGRLEEIENERKIMSKALMRQWGREELGIEEPKQGYVYLCSSKAAAG